MTLEYHERNEINSADYFCSLLKKYGINFVAGVPCGVQKKIIAYFNNDPEIPYVPAAREEDAVGIAVGAFLAGRKPLVLMQNSGFANSINSISSLLLPYKIPVLFLVTWRGFPGWRDEDVPHHLSMGKALPEILRALGLYSVNLEKNNVEDCIKSSMNYMQATSMPSIMLIRRYILQ